MEWKGEGVGKGGEQDLEVLVGKSIKIVKMLHE
jgi:hypothetical protein